MRYTTLFRVEATTADTLRNLDSEPPCELIRAESPREAAEIAARFWSHELKDSVSVDLLTVQRLHEPLGGTGPVHPRTRRRRPFRRAFAHAAGADAALDQRLKTISPEIGPFAHHAL